MTQSNNSYSIQITLMGINHTNPEMKAPWDEAWHISISHGTKLEKIYMGVYKHPGSLFIL